MTGFTDVDERAKLMRADVLKQVNIPTCVGVGESKTLAKLANFVAKRHPKSTGTFNLNTLSESQAQSVFANIAVEEVWGIGRQLNKALTEIGIHTVSQLRLADPASMRKRFGIVMEKTIRELRGESCIEIEEMAPAKKQMITSRSFGKTVTEIEDLQDALAHFVSNVAKKLRQQHSIAGVIQIFILTDRFREDQPQYCPSVTLPLPVPTSNTILLQRWAIEGLRRIYRPGFHFKKAGVMLSDLRDENSFQGDLFERQPGSTSLMETLDAINTRYGRGTLKLSQDGSRQTWHTKQARLSPAYTTSWDDLPTCR